MEHPLFRASCSAPIPGMGMLLFQKPGPSSWQNGFRWAGLIRSKFVGGSQNSGLVPGVESDSILFSHRSNYSKAGSVSPGVLMVFWKDSDPWKEWKWKCPLECFATCPEPMHGPLFARDESVAGSRWRTCPRATCRQNPVEWKGIH